MVLVHTPITGIIWQINALDTTEYFNYVDMFILTIIMIFQYKEHEGRRRIRGDLKSYWEVESQAQRTHCCLWWRQWTSSHWSPWDSRHQHILMGKLHNTTYILNTFAFVQFMFHKIRFLCFKYSYRVLQTVEHLFVLEETLRKKERDTLRTEGQLPTWTHTSSPPWLPRLPFFEPNKIRIMELWSLIGRENWKNELVLEQPIYLLLSWKLAYMFCCIFLFGFASSSLW